MNLGQRVKTVRENHGLSVRAFANKVGSNSSVISNCERGINFPNSSVLIGIATAWPELSTRWLLTGEGEMWEGASGRSLTPSTFAKRGETLELLAKRGGTVQAWDVWRELSNFTTGCTVEQLATVLNTNPDALQSDLSILAAYGLVSKNTAGWKANHGQLISDDIAASAQHRIKVVGMLLEPPPRTKPRPNRLITAALRVNPTKVDMAKSKIIETIHHTLEEIDEDDGDLITVVLAILDAENEMG